MNQLNNKNKTQSKRAEFFDVDSWDGAFRGLRLGDVHFCKEFSTRGTARGTPIFAKQQNIN